MNLVEQAIAEIREQTVEHIVNQAQIQVNRILRTLEEANWDLEVVYPYPKSYGPNAVHDRKKYKSMLDIHNFALRLTKTDKVKHPYCRKMNDPDYRVRNEDGIKHYMNTVREAADASFKSFVFKLTEKIGLENVVSVELDPIYKWLWDYSILHVTRNDGAKEKWKTQIIVKTSCLGTVFNQWPTRKVK